jgi:ferredoxin
MTDCVLRSVLDLDSFAHVFAALRRRAYDVAGPTVRDGAIVYETLSGIEDLPAGWTDTQEPGRYRLKRCANGALFGFHCGPQSWKKFLHPANLTLFNGGPQRRYALMGVRPCELAALRLQDRVLIGDTYPDSVYSARRRDVFILAVQCSEPSSVCFCESMKSGPRAESGFDVAITELTGDGRHEFVLEAGSDEGAELVRELGGDSAEGIRRPEPAPQQRTVEPSGLHDILIDKFEHPRWDEVARRCLCCGNCTMVCPTCFCTTVEDTSDITGAHTSRVRKWDSCFTLAFSYIHGGSVRMSAKARYRQWLTHKFAYWIDQFGSSGCVGCGRCITWCPAAIDITEELRAIREPATPAATREHHDGNT